MERDLRRLMRIAVCRLWYAGQEQWRLFLSGHFCEILDIEQRYYFETLKPTIYGPRRMTKAAFEEERDIFEELKKWSQWVLHSALVGDAAGAVVDVSKHLLTKGKTKEEEKWSSWGTSIGTWYL